MKRFWLSAIAACGMCILGAISAGAEDSTEVPVETQISTVVSEEPTEVTTETSYTDITTISTEITTDTTTTVTEVTFERGDANCDGEINVRDASTVARSLAEGKGDELPESADYNHDGIINVRDASLIATKISNNSAEWAENNPANIKGFPQKSDYNLKTIKGMQSYVNNWIKCYAEKTYGITAVAFDDTVDENEYSWFGPGLFIQNPEYYMDEMEKEYGVRCLEIGSRMYEYNVPECYKGDPYMHFAKDEGEMATLLIQKVKTDVDMMIENFIASGDTEESIAQCTSNTIKWKNSGGGNYEIYWLWGEEKKCYSKESFFEYWNISKENESKWEWWFELCDENGLGYY